VKDAFSKRQKFLLLEELILRLEITVGRTYVGVDEECVCDLKRCSPPD